MVGVAVVAQCDTREGQSTCHAQEHAQYQRNRNRGKHKPKDKDVS